MIVLLDEETKARLATKMEELEENPENGDNKDSPEMIKIIDLLSSKKSDIILYGFFDPCDDDYTLENS